VKVRPIVIGDCFAFKAYDVVIYIRFVFEKFCTAKIWESFKKIFLFWIEKEEIRVNWVGGGRGLYVD
jgi:hypothetical protein